MSLSLHSMNSSQTIATYQPLLQAIAHNLVQCKADAEDIVQDTFLKCLSLGPQKIENIKAYLVRAVINNCHTHLQKLQKKKEDLFDSVQVKELMRHFKESNVTQLDLDINLSVAFKVIATKLEPLERAVYLLKEIFDFDYDALQETLDKKKEHCRQLFCRAKKKLQNDVMPVELMEKPGLLEKFKQACHFGQVTAFVDELKNDISVAFG